MKIIAKHYYINSFSMDVPDNATSEEINKLISEEDEYLGGDWYVTWEEAEEYND